MVQALLAEQGEMTGEATPGDNFYVMVVLMALVHEAAGVMQTDSMLLSDESHLSHVPPFRSDHFTHL